MLDFFFSSRRRHTSCALVTGVQTCALPILGQHWPIRPPTVRTGADGALMHRAKPVQPLAPGLAGRTAGEAQSLDHRSGVHPPQPGAAGEDRMRYRDRRSEEHTSELQSLMSNSYDVFRLKKNINREITD